MLLVLVACAAVGGTIGGWLYATRTPQVTLCTYSGVVGDGTAQGDAAAEAYNEAAVAACDANAARLSADAARFDPVGFVAWATFCALVAVIIGWVLAVAYSGRRPRQSVRGRGW